MPLQAPAIQFEQNGQRMYLAVISAKRIADRTTIDHWSPDRRTGYQRMESGAHIRSIAEFVKQPDALLPLPGILNVRDYKGIHFEPDSGEDPSVGHITIDDGVDIYVVDMQHRREGLKKAYEQIESLKNFPVPVVIFDGLATIDEVLQFYVVNQKSKRIQSDLAMRLLIQKLTARRFQILVGDVRWQRRALAVTMMLNNRFRNPWKGRIKEPNVEKEKRHTATEKSFVPGLRFVVNHPELSHLSDWNLAQVLAGYWEGIEDLFPEAMRNPADHAIMGVTSYVAFHRLLPLVITKRRNRGRLWTQEMAKETTVRRLAGLKSLGSKFWDADSSKGVKRFGGGFGAGGRLYTFLATRARLV